MSSKQAGEPRVGDAFGLALLDYLEHGSGARSHFIERDDGLLETIDTGVLFTQESDWSVVEAPVGDRAGQRVLDVGAGAGRHALPLQESGREVVALDVSSGAAEVCRRRGVRETFTGTVFELAGTGPEPFDTFLLCGNNYGLLESPEHGLSFLGALAEMAVPGAEIIGTCIDPFATEDPLHVSYHERNRRHGRHPGQIRLRARWSDVATTWFDYLFFPVEELKELGERAGWELVEHQPGSRPYLAVLRLHEARTANNNSERITHTRFVKREARRGSFGTTGDSETDPLIRRLVKTDDDAVSTVAELAQAIESGQLAQAGE